MNIAPIIGPYVRSLETYDYARIASITIHFVNLTHAVVHDIHHFRLIHLLSTCPSLRSLELNLSNLIGFADVHTPAQEGTLAGTIETLIMCKIHSGLAEFLRWAAMSTELFSQVHTIKCWFWTTAEPETTFTHCLFPLMRHCGDNLAHISIANLPFDYTDCELVIHCLLQMLGTYVVIQRSS